MTATPETVRRVNVLDLLPDKADKADKADLPVFVEQEEDLAGGGAAAVFDSEDRTYRYLLTRIWDQTVPPAVFVMLNPSTADALKDDPTINRLAGPNGFARRIGAGGLVVVNLFAMRSTDPRVLRHHPDPVGPLNDAFIRRATADAFTVVAAWGAGGVLRDRGAQVTAMLADLNVPLQCLGVTSTGQPRHPLYLPGAADLIDYVPEAFA